MGDGESAELPRLGGVCVCDCVCVRERERGRGREGRAWVS